MFEESASSNWVAAMCRGDFSAAWQGSDRLVAARGQGERSWHLPRHEHWVWDGRPLAGRRVLVHCYHGLGDTIQFARFLPRLDSIARETIVWAQPPLLSVLQTLPGSRHRILLPLRDGNHARIEGASHLRQIAKRKRMAERRL